MLNLRSLRFVVLTFVMMSLDTAAVAQQQQSSDGTVIAYISPSRDNQQIRLINPDGSNASTIWNGRWTHRARIESAH